MVLRVWPLVAAAALALFVAVPAAAQTTYTWTAASGGVFGNAANWTPAGGPPNAGGPAGDIAQFNLPNTYTVNFTAAVTNARFFVADGTVTWALNGQTYSLNSGTSTVGNTANQIARLVVTNGTVTTTANAPQIGSVAGAVGFMTLSTGAAWVLPTGTVLVGNAGTGTLTAQNGAALTTSFLTLGSTVGGSGSVIVTGAGSTATVTGGTVQQIGDVGGGDVTVQAGGQLLYTGGPTVRLASSGSASGSLTVTGPNSRLAADTASFVIGGGGIGGATFSVLAGGSATTGAVTVAQGSPTAGGTVDGAGSTWTAASLTVGGFGGTTGTLTVSNGGRMAVAGSATVGANTGNAVGNLTVSESGASFTSGALTIGGGLSGASTVTVNAGGSLTTGGLTINSPGSATASLVVNGGTVTAGAATVAAPNGAVVLNGGMLAVTSLSRFGALTVNDGTLAVSGGTFNPNAAGTAPFVLNGNTPAAVPTLRLTGPGTTTANITALTVGSTSAAAVEVAGGAVLTTTGPATLGTSPGATGSMTVTGSGSTWAPNSQAIIIGNAGTGTLTASNFGFVDNIAGTGTLGGAAGGVGTANLDRGTWFSGATVVGGSGRGTVHLTNGGGFVASGNLDIGLNAGGRGDLIVTGADSTLSTFATRVGVAGQGFVRVSDGGQWFSNGLVTIGGSAFGQVVLGPGGRWAAGDVTVGPSNSFLFQNGGVLDVFGTFTRAGQYTFDDGAFNVFGTFVNSPSPNAFFLNGGTATSLPTMTIKPAGTTTNVTTANISFDRPAALVVNGTFTTAGAVTVGSQFGGNGTVTVGPSGILNVSGNNDLTLGSATGGVGKLVVDGGIALVSGTLVVQPGSTLTLNSGQLFIGNPAAAAGTIAFNGGVVVTSGNISLHNGKLSALLGPAHVLAGAQSFSGGGTTTVDSFLTVNDGGSLASSSLTNNATIQVHGGQVFANGTLTNTAGRLIAISGTGLLTGQGGIVNAGTLQLADNLVPTAGGPLSNTGTIRGTGFIGNVLSNGSAGQVQVTAGNRIECTSAGSHSNAGVV